MENKAEPRQEQARSVHTGPELQSAQTCPPESDKEHKRFGPAVWLKVAANITVVAGVIVAIMQLRQGNTQAKVSYTLEFVQDLETSEFEEMYRMAIEWFEENPSASDWPPNEELALAINHVLNRYSSLAAFYNRDVLDRTVIDNTVGLQVPPFYRAAEALLKAKKVPGYEELAVFSATVERIIAQE